MSPLTIILIVGFVFLLLSACCGLIYKERQPGGKLWGGTGINMKELETLD